MSIQTKAFPCEIKAEGDGSTFAGRASVYGVLDSQNEIVARGAFAGSIDRFLKRGAIYSQHSVPIGKPTSAVETPGSLDIGGKISDTAEGRDCKTLMRDGVIQSLSIGYLTLTSEQLEGAKQVADYWATISYKPTTDEVFRSKWGARVLTSVELKEVSLVTFPSNPDCLITDVKGHRPQSLRALLAAARGELGETKSGRVLSEANRKRLQGHADALLSTHEDIVSLLKETDPEAGDAGKAELLRAFELGRARLGLYS